MIQLICHLVGDYLLQSDWMANNKTKRTWPAIIHVVLYTLPFLVITRSAEALAVIAVSHFIMDRFRLARYVCWAKNYLAPRGYNDPWHRCTATGYPTVTPLWLSGWLMIIADNTIHLACNAVAIAYL